MRRVTQWFRASCIGDYDDPSSFLDVLTSDNGRNDMGWHDARYDGLVAQAAREEDASRRADLLAHAERRALDDVRSEEQPSELQSLMRSSYAVFCLKKTKKRTRRRYSET